MDALSISMNAHNEDLYLHHCRPKKRYLGAYAGVLGFSKGDKEYVSSVSLTVIDGVEGVDIDAISYDTLFNLVSVLFTYNE